MQNVSDVARDIVKGIMGEDCFDRFLVEKLRRGYVKNPNHCDECGNASSQCDCGKED